MNNFVLSQIRTYTPIAAGAFLAWLASRGITLDANAQASLIVGLTGLTQAVYYFVIRVLEKYAGPKFGWLLGSTQQPTYVQK